MTKISKIKVQGITHEIKDNEAYVKPASGIPASDIASGVIPDVSAFITKSVSDLTNYYLKSETYTQTEINNLIGGASGFSYQIADSTSAVTSPTSNILYLIGPTGSGSDKYEEYVYPNSTIGWTKIGDTSIDLSSYVTTSALNTALTDYTTTTDMNTLLDNKVDKISGKGLSTEDYTSEEKTKLSDIETGAQVNVLEGVKVDGTEQTITNKTVNLPAYPTTLPASDVYAWAKAATKPTYTPSEIGAATSAQGSLADSAIQTIQINGTVQTKTNGVVNLPAYPTTLPASDVYSWAKASTKPSYTFTEITSKPTTISGYGITDAHITNGVITIGNNTITPLTSFTESDPTVPAWAKASSKPTYNLDEVSDGTTRKLSNYKTIASLQSKGNVNVPIYFDSSGNAQVITGLTLDGELSGNSFKVIAEHLSRITSRIKNLEDVLDTANDLVANSIDSAEGYYRNGDKTILTGSGAPTVVPAFIGQFYINTSGPALYYAVNNSATTDWKQA